MKNFTFTSSVIICLILQITLPVFSQEDSGKDALKVDFYYAPKWWQTAVNLNDDALKTLVGKEGSIYYDYNPWPCDEMVSLGETLNTFNTEIAVEIPFTDGSYEQKLMDPGIPVLETRYENDQLSVIQEVFAVGPPFIKDEEHLSKDLLGTSNCKDIFGAPRNDINIVSYKNTGSSAISFKPEFIINSAEPLTYERENNQVKIGEHLTVKFTSPIDRTEILDSTIAVFDHKEKVRLHVLKLYASQVTLHVGEEFKTALGVSIGKHAVQVPNNVEHAMYLKERTLQYWNNLGLPYDRIQVPDSMIQALVQSSVRNIFQAREIKNGLPAFQVGPTRYRGLWIVDGSFLLESMTFLGQIDDVRNGIEYMMSFQNSDGSFELLKEHWKETGIVLWAVTRHARLTGDKDWLNHHWPKLEKAFAYIDTMRQKASMDPNAPNYNLIPAGASDGGLWKILPEYTNIYWTMAGMKAAVEAAEWLGKNETANIWSEKYNSFYMRFNDAAKRDMKKDDAGNDYLPIYMVENEDVLPQKAQWAFLHAVFPGKVFEQGNKVVKGNMAMLLCCKANFFLTFFSFLYFFAIKPCFYQQTSIFFFKRGAARP